MDDDKAFSPLTNAEHAEKQKLTTDPAERD